MQLRGVLLGKQNKRKRRPGSNGTKQDDFSFVYVRFEGLFVHFAAFFAFSASIDCCNSSLYVRKIVLASPSIVNSLP